MSAETKHIFEKPRHEDKMLASELGRTRQDAEQLQRKVSELSREVKSKTFSIIPERLLPLT